MEEKFGGITLDHVIQFQTRILFGAQYGRIELAREKTCRDQLILACLRMGWNDAFRHVTTNQKDVEKKKKDYEKRAKKNGGKSYDDYYSSILNNNTILNTFKAYAYAENTEKKCDIIRQNQQAIFDVLKEVKVIKSCEKTDKPLCFGHVQKLFNITVKLYLCVYMCREYLGLEKDLFDENIVNALQFADCPIDSIILGRTADNPYPNLVWSKIESPEEISTYTKIQDHFRNQEKNESSLYFDFTHWN